MLLIESLKRCVDELSLSIHHPQQLTEIASVVNDSRKVQKNDVYIAIVGDHFDGHQFIDEEMANKCSLIISEKDLSLNVPYVKVDHSIKFIQKWAHIYRDMHAAKFIGITGTNGKTTTKEMLQAVLSQRFNCYATPGNFNNHIGLPLALLNLPESSEVAILEIGTNQPGEIPFLTDILQPDLALITNIGFGHMENFKNFDELIYEKTDLFRHSPDKTVVFINQKDENLKMFLSNHKRITFGVDVEADYAIESIESAEDGSRRGTFDGMMLALTVLGDHQLENAAAVIAITKYLELDTHILIQTLATFHAVSGRMETLKMGDYIIINDAYNANPVSMHSALTTLAHMKNDKPKIAIIADMLELGKDALEKHQEIIEYAETLELDHIITFGPIMSQTKSNVTQHFEQIETIAEWLAEQNQSALILLKGSRGMALERIIDQLKLELNGKLNLC